MTDETDTDPNRGPRISGFQTVDETEKAGMVHGVFTNVASKYDVMNDVMSRRHPPAVEGRDDGLARAAPGQRLLDVAGGTGDIAFRFLKRAPGATATVLDMTEAMLVEGASGPRPAQLADSSTGSSATRWRCRSRTTASTSTRSASASGT
jgi:demethylmenaquinone methyltransferase/2-methoxy-6-polyprenyl-1,4-benzoquinol methylase